MNKYRKRKDGNQRSIEQALTSAGIPWKDVHIHPGMLDILAAPFGEFHFLEVKQPGENLTESEKKFFNLFPNAPRHVVSTPEEAFEKMEVKVCPKCRIGKRIKEVSWRIVDDEQFLDVCRSCFNLWVDRIKSEYAPQTSQDGSERSGIDKTTHGTSSAQNTA